jgi:hypothetical protein
MNLHNIVAPYISAVNPPLLCSLKASIGYETAADGTQQPAYASPVDIEVQTQALQYNDIAQLNGLNIQGKRLAMYINGDWEGVVRSDSKGGDIITLPDGSVWLCAMVLENWSMSSGWTKIAATQQNKV